MDLSVIIPSYNTKDILVDCILSIVKHTKKIDYEIIVVDNGSEDGTVGELKTKKIKNLNIIENKENLGFAAANNQGTKIAKGDWVLYLNSDTLILNNVLSELLEWIKMRPEVGIVSCGLKNKNGSFQASGGYFPNLLNVFSWMTIQDLPFVDNIIPPFHPFHSKSGFFKGESFYKNPKQLDWVTGAFLLTQKNLVDQVGGWDDKYFMYMEEVDLCYRIKKLKVEVWYVPLWSIIHFGGSSSNSSEFAVLSEFKGLKKFFSKFKPSWQTPFLRLLLKLGSLGRIFLFGILEGKEGALVYAKAFREA